MVISTLIIILMVLFGSGWYSLRLVVNFFRNFRRANNVWTGCFKFRFRLNLEVSWFYPEKSHSKWNTNFQILYQRPDDLWGLCQSYLELFQLCVNVQFSWNQFDARHIWQIEIFMSFFQSENQKCCCCSW